MSRTDYINMMSQICRGMVPSITSGVLLISLLSGTLLGFQVCLDLPAGLSVGSDVFTRGHVHALLLFSLHHRSFSQLLLSTATFVLLSTGLEKGLGTIRFLFSFLVLSTCTGVLYSLVDLLLSKDDPHHTEGLVPVALACVAVTTMHNSMSKSFLCGVSFPSMALPWVFVLATSAFVPHAVLPCNILAALVGWLHGKGWFSYLDLTEARAGVLEKMMPFRLLRRITVVTFVPASMEERRKTLLPQVTPTPGSYPVQAYAPQTSQTKDKTYEGWPTSDIDPSLTAHVDFTEQSLNHSSVLQMTPSL